MGASNDFIIRHNGTDNTLGGNATTKFFNPLLEIYKLDGTKKAAAFNPDGSQELYYNNVLRLETRTNDVKFHGGLVGIDNAQIQLGNSADLKLYHDGTDSYLDNTVTGILRIRGNSGAGVELHPKGGQYGLRTIPDGATELYHSGNKKAETVTGGFTVTGTCTATAFAGDGSALTGIQGIPSGVIMMWSGAVNAIPSGFVLCNGLNGTPNLIDKFVVGAASVYSVGDTGGATTDTISLSVSGSTSSSISQAYSARTNYNQQAGHMIICLLYTSPSPRD